MSSGDLVSYDPARNYGQVNFIVNLHFAAHADEPLPQCLKLLGRPGPSRATAFYRLGHSRNP